MLQEREPRHLIACTDGSDTAYTAFEVALKEFMDEKDRITVYHISDVEKTYLNYKYTVPAIIDRYKVTLLSNLIQTRYTISIEERDRAHFDEVRKQVAYKCAKLSADYVFIGSFGRKGEQETHYRVGKTALAMAKASKVPVVIVKKKFERAKNKTKGFNFICCIDGSKQSLKTLDAAKDLARNPNDKIYTLTIYNPEQTNEELLEEMKTKMETTFEERKIKVEQTILYDLKENSIEESLEEYINFEGTILFDFVLMGVCGKRAEYTRGYFLGKTADHLIRRAFVNPILVP